MQTLTTSDQSQTLTNKTLTAPIVTDARGQSPAAGSEGKVIWLDDGPQGLVGDVAARSHYLFGYNWIANAYDTQCRVGRHQQHAGAVGDRQVPFGDQQRHRSGERYSLDFKGKACSRSPTASR